MIDIMKQGLGLRTPQQERFGNSQELKSFGGRYRTRTARPRRRRGNQSPSGALISARFPTARNVYRDDYRFVVDGTGLEQQRRPQRNRKFHSAGGYSFIGEYGILGLIQQIGTCRGEAPPSCYARPFCHLKAPLGLSLLRYASQTRIYI